MGHASTPASVTPAPVRAVRVCDPDTGDLTTIRLRWLCPVPDCRRPRGEPHRRTLKYHDHHGTVIARARVDVWHNPCGHIQLITQLLAEAATLAAATGGGGGPARKGTSAA